MCRANGRQHYIITLSLISWAHSKNDPCHFGYRWHGIKQVFIECSKPGTKRVNWLRCHFSCSRDRLSSFRSVHQSDFASAMSSTEELLAEHREWLRKFQRDVSMIGKGSSHQQDVSKSRFIDSLYPSTENKIVNSLAPGKFEWNFRHVILKRILVIDGWGISCQIALIIALNLPVW